MATLGYNGIKDSGTFIVDATTATAIGTSLAGEANKAYTISADGKVGYGASGDIVFGIVQVVEKESANSTTLLASLKMTGMVEAVTTTTVAANLPVIGKKVLVDGAGALIVAATAVTADAVGNAIAFSVDATNHLAIIRL